MTAALNKARRIALLLLAVLLGGGCSLFAVLWWQRGQAAYVPVMTRQTYQQALDQWRAARLEDYELQVEVGGPQAAVYKVRVRDGQVVESLRNERPLPQQRTWSTWSVAGMFSTLATDLAQNENLEGQAGAAPLSLRAEFDAQWGIPLRYHRVERRARGENPEIWWKVLDFSAG